MNEKTAHIYTITCKPTGDVYVGCTANVRKRWNRHRQQLRDGCHHSQSFQKLWDIYRPHDFELVIVQTITDSAEAIYNAEADLIGKIGTLNVMVPDANKRLRQPEEIRALMSRLRSAWEAENGRNDEARAENMREHTARRWADPELSKDLRKGLEAAQAAVRGKKRGPQSAEQRAASGAAVKRAWQDPNNKLRAKTFVMSPEGKAAVGAAAKARWERYRAAKAAQKV